MVFNCLPALHKKVEPFIQSNQFTSVSVNSGDDKESLSESLLVKHLGIYRVQLTWFNVPVYFLVQENIHKGIQESDACIEFKLKGDGSIGSIGSIGSANIHCDSNMRLPPYADMLPKPSPSPPAMYTHLSLCVPTCPYVYPPVPMLTCAHMPIAIAI